jgi:hypothetical protein
MSALPTNGTNPTANQNDFNWLQFGGNLLDLAGGYYLGKEGSEQAMELGQKGFEQAQLLGQDVAGMTRFQPFTVTTGLGTATTTPEGGFTLGLSPQQQAMQRLGLTGAHQKVLQT